MNSETHWHNLSNREAGKILETDLENGLTEREVKARQEKFGFNKLPGEKPLSRFKIFLEQFRSPLIYILVLAGIIILIFRKFTDAIVIFGAVFLNVIVGYFQESKASKALKELKKIVKIEAQVIRENNEKRIDSSGLVPGDIIILSPGNKVPADGRLVESHNLKINEAPLTGEWLSAEKDTKILPPETPLADRDNMVYMGSVAEEGTGKVVVTATGLASEMGKIASLVRETKEEKTPLQKKLAKFSRLVGAIIFTISAMIFFGGVIRGGDSLVMFETAVAVAVAAIPEGLPVAMTVILALGMQRILKRKGLVRKLLAAETLGSTSVICTDKTGTLTEGKMQISGIYTGTKELLSDGQKYLEKVNKNGIESHILALKTALFCSEAFIENPTEPLKKWIVRGRPTDKALLIAGIQAGLNKKELEAAHPRIINIPFNSVLKYSASLHIFSAKENILYLLGAPEKILERSKYIEIDGKKEILSGEKIRELKKRYETLAAQGQRILATAYKKIAASEKTFSLESLKELSQDLVFVGFIALRDPLRKDAKRAIEISHQAGLRPIIVTGDHQLTAKAIAEELGFKISEENIITGNQLDQISDEELEKKIVDFQVHARVEPRHKVRIISAWQQRGEVVAMTGDGINDAPALKKSDIGVALGSGTDVAKEVSDLVLLTDSFNIIVRAIEEGRTIIHNLRKVITYLLSDSFTETILIGTSIVFGLPLPVAAVQILWVNLIEDGLPSIALVFEPKEKDVMERKAQGKDIPLLTREMKVIIFIIGIFTDLILLGVFLWLLGKFGKDQLYYIQTMIFAGLGINSLFYIFSCKSLRKNLWHINPFSNKFLVISVVFGFLMLIASIYLPIFQTLLGTVRLEPQDWLIILGLGIINVILIEATKWYFIIKRKIA